MPIDILNMIGAIDMDSPLEAIPKGYLRDAWNIDWYGTAPNMRGQQCPGTNLVPNSFLPNTGSHLTIHSYYDPVGKRVIFFNFNSTGLHGIYIWNTLPKTMQVLIQTGLNTVGDPLGFTATGRIHSAHIIYGDANTGDLLFYVDSLGRPTKLNIQRFLSGFYNGSNLIKRSYLEVIKAPPRMPPRVTYENDYTVTVNNLLNALFKFRVRWVYLDNDKSVYSTASITPLPAVNSIITTNPDPTQSSRISVYVPTGDNDVKKIEIWVQQTTDGLTGDWLLVTSLDKVSLGLSDNDIYRFLFFNDAQYTAGIQAEILQLQDKVPLQANDMALLNGNTPVYGGILEGFNPLPPSAVNISVSVNENSQPPVNTTNGLLFFAAQGGVDSYGTGNLITVYLTGAGNNDGSGNPTTVPIVGVFNSFVVDCATSGGSSLKFTYSNLGLATSIPTILAALQAAAIANGFTAVGATPNSITLSYPGVVLYYAQATNFLGDQGLQQAYFSYATKCAYQDAICYFDQYGRTPGATLPNIGGINTPEDLTGTLTPQKTMTIGHRPPSYAYYYSWVRSPNLTYNERLMWVCNQTFINQDLSDNNTYAFVGISNMFDYNQNINTEQPNTSASKAVVSYDFVQGDRIRFLIRYPVGASQSILTTTYDYPISAVVINPTVNGVVQQGRFIKILYPKSDINANFDFVGDAFQNYKVLIYNIVKHPTNVQNTTFFEFGKTYAIGNPGTNTAYHIGSDQTQSADLSRPAIITNSEGDLFFRQRIVPAGGIYYINVQETGFSNHWVTWPTLNDQGVIDNPRYQIGQQNAASASPDYGTFPIYTSPNQIYYNKLSSPVQIRLRSTGNGYTVTGDKSLTHKLFVKVVTTTGATITYLLRSIFAVQGSTAGQIYTVSFDEYVPIPAGAKAWLIAANESISGVSNCFLGGFILRLDALNNIQIPIIESSFSDKYNIQTNSNLRPVIYDPNAGQFFYGALYRWGEPDQVNTIINNSNRFYDQNSDEITKEYGSIKRLIVWQKRLRIAQERKWGEVGVFDKYIRNNTGENQLIVNDAIIQKNNIQYYEGDFGIGNQPDAIAVNGFQIWFVDPVRGAIMRLSLDGIKQISEEFKVQSFAGSLLPKYLQQYTYQSLGNSVVLGVYNFVKDRDSEAIFSFQGGVGSSDSLIDQSIKFIERRNAFGSRFNYAPDSMVCAENLLISFKNGHMYTHDNTSNGNYSTFYGNQFPAKMDFVFNEQEAVRKTYLALAYQSQGKIWTALNIGDIYTSTFNPQTGLQQISKLFAEDFEVSEGGNYTNFLRDANSMANGQVALWEGDYLKGYYIRVLLQSPDNNLNFLFAPYINWAPSPRNF